MFLKNSRERLVFKAFFTKANIMPKLMFQFAEFPWNDYLTALVF